MNHSQAGRMGAHSVHARGKTNTRPGTEAFLAKFEREVDPEGKLPVAERAKRVEHAKSLHFSRLTQIREAKRAARNRMDDVQSGNVWPEED